MTNIFVYAVAFVLCFLTVTAGGYSYTDSMYWLVSIPMGAAVAGVTRFLGGKI